MVLPLLYMVSCSHKPNFFVFTNPADPRVIEVEYSSGKRVTFHGKKNENGFVIQYTFIVIKSKHEKPMMLFLDESNRITSILDRSASIDIDWDNEISTIKKPGFTPRSIKH